MKRQIKKISYLLLSLLSICFVGLVVFMLNPRFSYSYQTNHGNITIYHNEDLDSSFLKIVDVCLFQLQNTLLYTVSFESDLCLNDGSIYPSVIRQVLGNDVLRAFSTKLVDLSEATDDPNKIIAWEQELELEQFLIHGFIHNLQYQHHGFFDANPLGNYPEWKWEGYVEYELLVETLGMDLSLESLIELLKDEDTDDYTWIDLGYNKKTLKRHIRYLAMTKYCFHELYMSYEEFMNDSRSEEEIYKEMMKR